MAGHFDKLRKFGAGVGEHYRDGGPLARSVDRDEVAAQAVRKKARAKRLAADPEHQAQQAARDAELNARLDRLVKKPVEELPDTRRIEPDKPPNVVQRAIDQGEVAHQAARSAERAKRLDKAHDALDAVAEFSAVGLRGVAVRKLRASIEQEELADQAARNAERDRRRAADPEFQAQQAARDRELNARLDRITTRDRKEA